MINWREEFKFNNGQYQHLTYRGRDPNIWLLNFGCYQTVFFLEECTEYFNLQTKQSWIPYDVDDKNLYGDMKKMLTLDYKNI